MRKYRSRKGRGGKRRRWSNQEDYSIRGRPLKEVHIERFPQVEKIIPEPCLTDEEIILTIAEYEAVRLVDYEGYNQTEAGELMQVSRGTIWRLLDSGRRKIIKTLINGQPLQIEKPHSE
jgi:hypothetical protein